MQGRSSGNNYIAERERPAEAGLVAALTPVGEWALWYTSNYMERREVTYSLVIEEQDGGYLAYFPALSGCNTFGATYEEAVNNAREALTVYLESLDELGKPFPKDRVNEPVSLGLTVRLPIVA